MKLLFLNHNLSHDGTYFRALPMAETLAKKGHSVTLLTVSRKRALGIRWSNSGSVRIGETPNLKPEFGAQGYGLLDLLARLGLACTRSYDIIHMFDHKPNATFPGFLGRSLRGCRLVADWADWWCGPGAINDRPHRFGFVHRFEEWWEVRSKLWADGVVTISQVLRQRALDCGCSPERVVYIPTGAPLHRIRPLPRESARAKLGIAAEIPLLGFVGISQDDLEILFQTLRQIPSCQLLLVGPVFSAVQQMAAEYGVLDRVQFPGRIHGQELNQYLACADLLCLPMKDNAYNRGRLPNKLMDYLAAGRPVVACPVGDVGYILERYRVGQLATPAEFPTTVSRLLQDPEQLLTLGLRSRQVAEEHFDWDRLIVALEDFYYDSALRGRH